MIYDFLIIGGGIAGASAAARLSALGSVLVLEAEQAFAYHASGRSAALFEVQYGHPLTIELNRASDDHHRHANGGVLSPRGLMMLAGPAEEQALDAEAKQMHLDPISVDEAAAMIPILNKDHVTAAAWHAAAWDLDTDRLIQNFLKELRANGGTTRTDARVTSLERGATTWMVRTQSETFETRTLVNAAGAWADGIAQMAGLAPVGLRPLRRSMARMPAPGGHDVSSWPMLHGVQNSWYAKADAGAWLVSPADEDFIETPHDVWADDMVLAEGIARYQPFVTEEVTRILTSWAGMRTFAPDRCLVLGPDPQEPSFVWVAGQGGSGFQTSPAASQLVADLVAGRQSELPPEVVSAMKIDRFR